jgi:HAD superfamily, subfamily IIIB (Acid phosphatase)
MMISTLLETLKKPTVVLGLALLSVGTMNLESAIAASVKPEKQPVALSSRPVCKTEPGKPFLCLNPDLKTATQIQASKPIQDEFEAVVARAQKYLDTVKPSTDKVLIFDLDDTLVDNTPHYAMPEPRNFTAWLEHRPVLYHESVLKLLKNAKQRGFSVMYITGRGAGLSLVTAQQVQDLPWDAAFTRPSGIPFSVQAYKASIRAMLRGLGYTIVLNIGDQITDHDLPMDEAKGEFLVPNVMYTVY